MGAEKTKPKFQGNPKKQRTDFMKEFDDLCAKDLREKCQKNSDEATSNDDNENNVENSMDVDNTDTLDDPTN